MKVYHRVFLVEIIDRKPIKQKRLVRLIPVGGGRRWEKSDGGEYGANIVHTYK
jgi:hypothetical protein